MHFRQLKAALRFFRGLMQSATIAMHSAPIDMNARVTAFVALSAYRIGSLRCEVRERSAYAAIIVADSKNR